MFLSHSKAQLGFDRCPDLQWEKGIGSQGYTRQPRLEKSEGSFVWCLSIGFKRVDTDLQCRYYSLDLYNLEVLNGLFVMFQKCGTGTYCL